MFTNIMVGYDGSRSGQEALRRAAAMTRESKGKLTAVWVREPLPRHSDLPGEFEQEAEAADAYFRDRQSEVKAIKEEFGVEIQFEKLIGHPAKAIVTFANEGGYDLIVVGHSDHSELWGRLLGDTANRIADHAHCSVLIVKRFRHSSSKPFTQPNQ